MHKGILYATICYTVWGLFPLYFKALHDIAPLQILLHRMVWSLLFLCLVLSWRKQWAWLPVVLKQKKLLAGFAASALLLSTNWFIYIWSVNNGHVIDASLGYFMTPLVSVLLGYSLLRERLRTIQWVAVSFAALGVAWMAWQTGHPPWIGLSLALSFGSYGLLRKTAALGALEGLSLETMIFFPFAASYLIWLTFQGQNDFLASSGSSQLLLMAAGPITAIPLLLFAAGARQIPLATMGLLQYISPSIQLLLGLLLYNEAFSTDRLIGFIAIWAGLLLYSGEGLFNSLRNKKQA